MLLEHSMQRSSATALVYRAIAKAIAQGYRTADLQNQGSNAGRSYRVVSTRGMGEVICNFIESPDAA
jgi:isocitrate/isopropylmalate dehydrogenase